MTSRTSPNGWNPSKKILCREGNISHSFPNEFLQGGRNTWHELLAQIRYFRVINEWKGSSHWVFSVVLPVRRLEFILNDVEVPVFDYGNESLGNGRVTDLSQRGKLPIWLSARDAQFESIDKFPRKRDIDAWIVECHTCSIRFFEPWSATDESDELWSVENKLMVEQYT